MTLTDFLLARIAEEEAAARAVRPLDYSIDMGGNRQDERWYVARLRFSSADGAARSDSDAEATALFARHDPARVLAECGARRRIAEEYLRNEELIETTPEVLAREIRPVNLTLEGVLLDLASVYADHPDYREEWRP